MSSALAVALSPLAGGTLLVLLGWAAGELVHPRLDRGDLRILHWLAAHRDGALTGLARTVTELGSMAVLAPVCVGVAYWLQWRRRWLDAATVVVVVVGALLVPNGVKELVDRPRPAVRHLAAYASSSFPSGHATQTMAVGLVLAVVLSGRSRRVPTIAVAVAFSLVVGWSRAYLGVHNPSDVVAGWVLGAMWAGAILSWRSVVRRTRSVPAAAPGTSPPAVRGAPRRPWPASRSRR